MRDPKRIRPFLEKLADYWETVPDWRFGQFVCNIQLISGSDLYRLEEEQYLKALKQIFTEEHEGEQEDVET